MRLNKLEKYDESNLNDESNSNAESVLNDESILNAEKNVPNRLQPDIFLRDVHEIRKSIILKIKE